MKRPLALLGLSAYLSLVLAALLGAGPAAVLAAVLGALGLCALFTGVLCRKRLSRRMDGRAFSLLAGGCAALLTAALCLGLFAWRWAAQVAPVQALEGKRLRIRATVLDYPEEQYRRWVYRLRVLGAETEDGTALDCPAFTARVTTWTPFLCEPYDGLECTVSFTPAKDDGGLYSTRNARLADGIAVSGYLSDYGDLRVLPDPGLSPGELAVRLRRRVGRGFARLLPEAESGLIRAILLGEQDRLDAATLFAFRGVGASHLLVVSGLHMSALTGLLGLALGRLGLRGRPRWVLTALGVAGFLCLIGFPVSAARSGVMILIYLLGRCLGRRPDGINSLGGAVLLLCLARPFSGGDLSLALSASGTFGLLLVSPGLALLTQWLGRGLGRVLAPAAQVLGSSLAVLVLTLPVQLLVFRGMSLLAPFATLVLMLPCTALLYLSAAGALLGLVPGLSPLGELFCLAAGWCARLVRWLSQSLAGLPGFFLDLTQPRNALGLGFVLLLLALALCLRRQGRRAVHTALAGAAAVCLCCAALPALAQGDSLRFATAADSGCVLLLRGDRAVVLSLGGYRTGAAAELLRRNNVRRVELLCLPQRDADAREAARLVLEAFPVERVALAAGAYPGRDLETAGPPLLEWPEDERLSVLGGVTLSAGGELGQLTVSLPTGQTAVVETAPGDTPDCDLLFTALADSGISATFTVLQNDAIMEAPGPESLAACPPGFKLIAAGDGLTLRFSPGGELELEGESHAGDQ